jgi:ferric-dicitrate binding protein FerR (iron transport regulator)
MDPLKKYSLEKAEEVFKTLPHTIADDSAYRTFLARREKARRRVLIGKVRSACTKVAAILFIPLALYTFYIHYTHSDVLLPNDNKLAAHIPEQHQPTLEYATPSGIQGKILLPDSTEVWLNSCTTLKTPPKFDSTGRYVELSGEAYFKVKSNKEWPMYIKSNGVTTKVLGTEFNLSAYKNEPNIKLTLINGKVELLKKDSSTVSLFPSEQLIVSNDPSGKHLKRRDEFNFENELAWKDGYLVFNNTPMLDVIKKMERWYGVDFRTTNPKILKYNFTGRFKGESITRVLDLMGISSNIRYRIRNNTVTLYQN